jgi:hypothetical protein
MYIYGNNNGCSIDNECKYGYSLYFPCVKTITRGENVCFDFYIVDNTTQEEIDLREVDDITLNITGLFKCNFGSFSYPEYIKSAQVEKFSEVVYDINFSDIINRVNMYIDIVDENHNLIESFLFDENLFLDIAIEGNIGYFLKGDNKYGILNINGYDTKQYMFLGWNIEESDEDCDLENIYDFLIKDKNLLYSVNEDITIRAVYQKRREYTIQMAKDNYDSSFIVDYMGNQNVIREGNSITVLEGHDVKISCIPNNVKPYKFVKWGDGYEKPYRVFHIGGNDFIISLKAHCVLNSENYSEYIDDIDVSSLNNFNTIYPNIVDSIFVDSFYIDNIYINNCVIDVLNDIPYIKIIEGGYIQVLNICDIGNLKLLLNNIGGDCSMFIDNTEVFSSVVDRNEFIFEFNGGMITLMGNNSCIFGLNLSKEVIYDKGKSMLCLSSEDTLKFYTGDLTVDGGIIVNGNPYGISPVKIAKVTNVTPLIMK